MRRRFIDTERDKRLCDVRDAKVIYYWSLKHNEILCSSNLVRNDACEICIPVYPSCKKCVFQFTNLSAFKEHLYYCENKWKREMVWIDKDQIPKNLKRKREIGDLSSLEDSEILRIHLDDKIIIKRRKELKKYLDENIDLFSSLSCIKDIKLTYSLSMIFDRLSELERLNKDYLVFEATETDLSRNESINTEAASNSKIVISSNKSKANSSNKLFVPSKKIKKNNLKNGNLSTKSDLINRLVGMNVKSIVDGIEFKKNNEKFKIFNVGQKFEVRKLDDKANEEFSYYKLMTDSINSKLENRTKLILKRKILKI